MKKNNIRLIIVAIALIGVDLASKYVFYDLRYMEETAFIRPTFNTGISRSFPLPFLIIIAISAIGIGVFIRLYIIRKINRTTAAFLIAGTAGNLIDRIALGGVRDFIDIRIFNFPIFNGADIMLTIGVILRIFVVTLEKKK